MTSTIALTNLGGIANALFNSVSANSTAVTSMSVGGHTINATSFAGTANNSTNLNGQAASFYTNASNLSTGTLPDARLSSAVVNTSGVFTISGNRTISANLTIDSTGELIIANGAGIFANGTLGTAGQTLTSNGTGVYWGIGGVNTAAQYAWTNTHTFAANVAFDTSTLFVDATNDRVGIGTAAPNATLAVVGTANVSGNVTVGGSISAANVTATVFTGNLTGTASSVTNGVYTTGDQTISGTKNFNGSLRNIVSSGWSNFYLGGEQGGYLWMHIGGDASNELRFGRVNRSTFNWEANPFTMNMSSAIFFATGEVRTPIFRLSSDTNSYWQANEFVLRGVSPTIFFRDTDHNSAMIHVNSNIFYVLRGGNDTTTWTTVGSGSWPLEINLTNNNAQFGGIVTAVTDMRAPIFYDSNDTNWYCNPNGLSRLVNLQLAVNNWNSTTEGWNRLYFASGDSSIYQGGSTGQWSHQFRNSDGNTRWLMEAAGNFWASGNITAYWSDKRLKKNVEKITDWRDIINGLNGYRYEWNDIGCKVLENSEPGVQVGLIAQEVQEVLPQAAAIQMMQYKGKNPDGTYEPKDGIDYDPENPYLTVREEKLIPVLVEAIKGVLQELDDLKVKYERLENLARGNI